MHILCGVIRICCVLIFGLTVFVCQENFEFKRVKTRILENKCPVVGKNGKNERFL